MRTAKPGRPDADGESPQSLCEQDVPVNVNPPQTPRPAGCRILKSRPLRNRWAIHKNDVIPTGDRRERGGTCFSAKESTDAQASFNEKHVGIAGLGCPAERSSAGCQSRIERRQRRERASRQSPPRPQSNGPRLEKKENHSTLPKAVAEERSSRASGVATNPEIFLDPGHRP